MFLYLPHIDIDSTVASDDSIKELADKAQRRGLDIGTVVAPIWPPTGGGSAMGDSAARQRFLGQVRKGCRVAKRLRELGVRPHGVVRMDSASGVAEWLQDPEGNQRRIADTFLVGDRLAVWIVLEARQRLVDVPQDKVIIHRLDH